MSNQQRSDSDDSAVHHPGSMAASMMPLFGFQAAALIRAGMGDSEYGVTGLAAGLGQEGKRA